MSSVEANISHQLDILALADALGKGELTSTAVTEHMLARIAGPGKSLNAYITVLSERALSQAAASDARRSAGQSLGLLDGVPIAIKDVCDIDGVPTTGAMRFLKDTPATGTATVVERLEAAGAVILGKTNLTEGVYAEHVEPYGPPRNPWNRDMYPGASSSGSGVAIAAELSFGAVSTDTGGSIRIPSAANGVTGLKPTWGRVSRAGAFELAATLDHIGPMTHSARDAAAMLQVMAGHDPKDTTSSILPVPDYLAAAKSGAKGMRVGVDRRWVSEDVDATTSQTLLTALDVLAGQGVEIVDITFPDPSRIIWDWFSVCAPQTARVHAPWFDTLRDQYGPGLAGLIDTGRTLSLAEYEAALLRREEFAGAVEALFANVDLVACPALAFPCPTLEQMKRVDERMVSGLHRFTATFTMSRHPTITMPGGFDDAGMPVAIQFVAPWFKEERLVAVGATFQDMTDHHKKRPSI